MKSPQSTTRAPWRRIGALAGLLLAVTMLLAAAVAAPAEAAFGLEPGKFEVSLSTTQAGAAADLTTSFMLNHGLNSEELNVAEGGQLKNVTVDLPPGLIGSATAVPKCSQKALAAWSCPEDTTVGTLGVVMGGYGAGTTEVWPGLLYSVEPFPGDAATFISTFPPLSLQVHVRSDGGLTTEVHNAWGLPPIIGTELTLWGIPADHHPGAEPRAAFMRNPSTCGSQGVAAIALSAWNAPDQYSHGTAPLPEITGCDNLPKLAPKLTVSPETTGAREPSGYDIELEVPQRPDPDLPGTPPLRDVTMQLPLGTAISPAAADGLASCSDAQLGVGTEAPVACPQASKVGSVSIDTPALDVPLTGAVYEGQPRPGEQFRLFLVAEAPGVSIRLAGLVHPDPNTGQLTTTFTGAPPQPFSKLHIHLKGGPRALLVNPSSCGPAESRVSVTPYGGGAAVSTGDAFAVAGDCSAAAFSPQLSAGSKSPIAGTFSPFSLRLARSDGEPLLGSLPSLKLPQGLLASLKGVPYCPDAALAAASTAVNPARTGAAELAAPACPASSQIGTAAIGAGAGSHPFYDPLGKVYLAGPYKGAPLSLAVSVPALAGPFDLGNVVVRSALFVDPVTTELTAVSDPFPTMLEGVPLQLRDIRLDIDRARFTVTPTSCEEMQVSGKVASTAGALAAVDSRYEVAGCADLGFRPHLALRFVGQTNRGAHPELRAVVRMPKGDAAIHKAVVTLPKTEYLEQAHIRTVCTRVQYAADNCPKSSIYGYAKAWSPLLDKPLRGPVYLRSSTHTLPDLVASLDGQIHVDLAGRIESVNKRIRDTFWAVPDAPMSKFELTMQGGKKGLLVNNTELCAANPRASVQFIGHNGKHRSDSPLVQTDCDGKNG